MAEPTTTTTGTIVFLALTFLSLFPGVDPAVVLGSFSGAVVFVMSSDDLSTSKKIGFFVPSFFGGLLTAGLVASILSACIPSAAAISVNPGVGALIASAMLVKILLWLIARDLSALIDLIKGSRS